MEFFGDVHVDKNDDVTGFSCMTVLSALTGEKGEEPGRFHLLTRGMYLVLHPLQSLFFSGRLPHGGTPPLAPPGRSPPPSALRCILIGYPSRAILSGGSRHTLAAYRPEEPLYVTPEMNTIQ